MLDKHRKKDQEDWEVYAECVRAAMARHGEFHIENRTNREKLEYEAFINGRSDHITIDGK